MDFDIMYIFIAVYLFCAITGAILILKRVKESWEELFSEPKTEDAD
uniref:Uncharacterized protein n=1 Tax=viral metagenome TaxID=1070528 RepID=A0A6M3JCA8_9ZZZZ